MRRLDISQIMLGTAVLDTSAWRQFISKDVHNLLKLRLTASNFVQSEKFFVYLYTARLFFLAYCLVTVRVSHSELVLVFHGDVLSTDTIRSKL